MKSLESFLSGLDKGATYQTELSKNDLNDLIELIIPDKITHYQFDKIVKNHLYLINNLQKQNQKLKQARDILLRRLMNQAIEVT